MLFVFCEFPEFFRPEVLVLFPPVAVAFPPFAVLDEFEFAPEFADEFAAEVEDAFAEEDCDWLCV